MSPEGVKEVTVWHVEGAGVGAECGAWAVTYGSFDLRGRRQQVRSGTRVRLRKVLSASARDSPPGQPCPFF